MNILFKYIISSNQCGFKPGDLSTNKLIFITHEIFQSFDDGLKVRSVFLDISKTSDKVWNNGVIYKLKASQAAGESLDTSTIVFKER